MIIKLILMVKNIQFIKQKKNKATYFPIEKSGEGLFSQLIFQMRKIE